jgi:hypothetical protein
VSRDVASAAQLATWIIEDFDPTEAISVEEAAERSLRRRGVDRLSAGIEAADCSSAVLSRLALRPPETLPFDRPATNTPVLVGIRRERPSDPPEVRAARKRLTHLDAMNDALISLGPCAFERIAAGVMRLSGATEAIAGCASDDGGIDVYGRIPLRRTNIEMPAGLLPAVILGRPLLYVAQCKCYARGNPIGRETLDLFAGEVSIALQKYHAAHRPSHAVPAAYYSPNETCLRVFFTTTTYTADAIDCDAALDMMLLGGREISGFLMSHDVGVDENGVSATALAAWAAQYA